MVSYLFRVRKKTAENSISLYRKKAAMHWKKYRRQIYWKTFRENLLQNFKIFQLVFFILIYISFLSFWKKKCLKCLSSVWLIRKKCFELRMKKNYWRDNSKFTFNNKIQLNDLDSFNFLLISVFVSFFFSLNK